MESINIKDTVIISAPKKAPKKTTKLLPGLASINVANAKIVKLWYFAAIYR